MSEAFFLGLDLGTTHVKCIALSIGGRVLASATRPIQIAAPRPGWAEQDAEAVWAAAAAALAEASGAAGPSAPEGLGLSGAMHTCLPASADGAPLAPALTWADRRAAGTCRRLREQEALREPAGLEGLYRRTGCPLQSLYHIPKLRWWIEHGPEPVRKAALFVTLKDFVLQRLTGTWAADLSTWSASGLLDIRRCRWDEQALQLAGAAADRLPPLASSFGTAGGLTPAASRACGLPSGLPVLTGASDGALANLGCGTLDPGQVVITVGTSGAIRQWVEEPRLDPAQRTWCYLLASGRWFAGGAVNNGGLAVQWVRERFYADLPPEEGYRRLFADAAQVAPGAEGVRCLPFFAGERSPYFRAEARAAFVGLGWRHGRGHLARAVLEAVAFRLADIWQALGLRSTGTPAASPLPEAARLTGAIVRSPSWVQLLCDVLGVELAAVETADASATGAALLAQACLDSSASLAGLAARIRPSQRWRPDLSLAPGYRRLLEEFRELYRRFVDNPAMRGYADPS